MKRLSAFVLALFLMCAFVLPTLPTAASADTAKTLSPATVKLFFNNSKNSVSDTFTSSKGTKLPYRLFVPADYDPNKSYPLVLSLHGAGEAGSDNEHVFKGGSILQRLLTTEEQKAHPCLILAPQCGSTGSGGKWVNSDWGPGFYDHTKFTISPYMVAAEELLDKVIEEYSVDETSLYVTGISMGGYGTWDIISRNPDKFAAAIPVCGGIDVSYMEGLKGMPIRTFHCKGDTIVSSAGTIKANELLKDHGDFVYTEYNSSNHDAWTEAYKTGDLMDWLFAQHTELPEVSATYTGDEGVTLEGAESIKKGESLEVKYTVKDGYVLESLTLNGNKIEFTDAKSGSVTITGFEGGEIKAVTKKEAVAPETTPVTKAPETTEAPVTDGETATPPATEAPKTTNAPMIIGIVAGVVVLAAVVVFLVVKSKKK
ncbi:MAG: hypothetical protein E7675_03370 [Ruminococcaceae bacterium]|nr:hypothetical protein [Oscillospiraceae bacterium]